MGAAGKRRFKNKMGTKEVLCPSPLCPPPLKQPLSLRHPPKNKRKQSHSYSPYSAGRSPGPRGSPAATASPAQLRTSRRGNAVSARGTRHEEGFPNSPLLLSSIPGCFAFPSQSLSYCQPLSLAPFLLCCTESGKEHTEGCLQPKHTCSCPQLPRPRRP